MGWTHSKIIADPRKLALRNETLKKYYATAKCKESCRRKRLKRKERYPEKLYAKEMFRRARRSLESQSSATMNKTPWCDVDDVFLLEFKGKLIDAARALGRTFYSVQQRRQMLLKNA